MITTKFWLDKRAVKQGQVAPLKLCIVKKSASAYIPINVKLLPQQWDGKAQKIIDHPNKHFLNNYIENRKIEIDNIIKGIIITGEARKLNATQLKHLILQKISPEAGKENLLTVRFKAFAESRKALRTKEIYSTTLKKILEFDDKADLISFDNIKKEWVERFSAFLEQQGLVKNSRNIHLRNLRAVINDAIDNNITTNYPLRKIDIRPELTVKRSLSVTDVRKLFTYPVEAWQKRYVDYFKLSFLLIGINPVDLLLSKKEAFQNGRLVYQRTKTGRWYNIKVEEEALSIINEYEGDKLLVNFAERLKRYKTFVAKADKGLKTIGPTKQVENPQWKPTNKKHRFHIHREPLFPDLSIYWCRHTWATIAFSIGIHDEIIAAALGHGHGNKVTSIYIDKSVANIDDANRKVIDYVLYGKL